MKRLVGVGEAIVAPTSLNSLHPPAFILFFVRGTLTALSAGYSTAVSDFLKLTHHRFAPGRQQRAVVDT